MAYVYPKCESAGYDYFFEIQQEIEQEENVTPMNAMIARYMRRSPEAIPIAIGTELVMAFEKTIIIR